MNIKSSTNKMVALSYRKESKEELRSKLILFFISPLMSLILSIKRINTRSSYTIFYLSAALFGFTLYVPAEKGLEALSVDSTYHRQLFEKKIVNETFSQYIDRFVQYVTFDYDPIEGDIIKDFYLDTVFYISSIFSSSHHFAFLLFTFLFAYVSLKCMHFVVLRDNFKVSYYTLCILLIFLFNQIINIHWLRFPTASWIAVYMIFQVYVNHNKRYWLLLPLTVIIHASFFAFVILMLIAQLSKRYDKFWIGLFFVSFFVSSIPPDFLEALTNFLPERFAGLINYASESSIEGRASLIEERRTGFFISLFAVIINIYMNILMLFIIKYRKEIKVDTQNLFSVLLVLFTIMNVFAFIKEFSERYRLITYPLLAYVWITVFPKVNKYSRIIYFVPFVFAYQLALNGYLYYMTSGYSMLLTPLYTVSKVFITGDVR